MLVQPELRIGPWRRVAQSESSAPGWLRWIDAAAGTDHLGMVRLVRGPSWFGLGPQRLEICETADASLVAALERRWLAFGRWQVFDAEHCRVGGLVGAHVLDEQGSRWATLWQDGPARHTIRGRSGRVFAQLEAMPDGSTHFCPADDLDANPFLRMVLLAACVLQTPAPS